MSDYNNFKRDAFHKALTTLVPQNELEPLAQKAGVSLEALEAFYNSNAERPLFISSLAGERIINQFGCTRFSEFNALANEAALKNPPALSIPPKEPERVVEKPTLVEIKSPPIEVNPKNLAITPKPPVEKPKPVAKKPAAIITHDAKPKKIVIASSTPAYEKPFGQTVKRILDLQELKMADFALALHRFQYSLKQKDKLDLMAKNVKGYLEFELDSTFGDSLRELIFSYYQVKDVEGLKRFADTLEQEKLAKGAHAHTGADAVAGLDEARQLEGRVSPVQGVVKS